MATPSCGQRQQCLYRVDTYYHCSVLVLARISHPRYDAWNAEDGPTRVLHLGSLLTLSGSDKEVLLSAS